MLRYLEVVCSLVRLFWQGEAYSRNAVQGRAERRQFFLLPVREADTARISLTYPTDLVTDGHCLNMMYLLLNCFYNEKLITALHAALNTVLIYFNNNSFIFQRFY